MEEKNETRGPLDAGQWPTQLVAHVVTTGDAPRIHGYDVQSDLARHYSASEVVLLTFTGELPTPEALAAFEVATLFAAPMPISYAPTHAASLARTCAGTTSSILGTGTITLAEQARVLLRDHASWIAWIVAPVPGVLPAVVRATAEDHAAVLRLRAALKAKMASGVPALEHDITLDAALIATFHAAGLVKPEQIESAFVHARLPAVVAEAFRASANYNDYPLHLPPIHYEDPR